MARLSKTLASALLTLSGYGLLLLIVLAICYGLFTLDYHLIWENIALYLQGMRFGHRLQEPILQLPLGFDVTFVVPRLRFLTSSTRRKAMAVVTSPQQVRPHGMVRRGRRGRGGRGARVALRSGSRRAPRIRDLLPGWHARPAARCHHDRVAGRAPARGIGPISGKRFPDGAGRG